MYRYTFASRHTARFVDLMTGSSKFKVVPPEIGRTKLFGYFHWCETYRLSKLDTIIQSRCNSRARCQRILSVSQWLFPLVVKTERPRFFSPASREVQLGRGGFQPPTVVLGTYSASRGRRADARYAIPSVLAISVCCRVKDGPLKVSSESTYSMC